MRVSGAGWRTVTLPWSAFEFDQAAFAFLKYVKEFKIAARFADGKSGGKIQLRNVRVVKAPTVALKCDVRGKSAVSGGQRQRIAIARTFLRNPRVLILDEATSALDSGSETAVQQALECLMTGRTTFIITHRQNILQRVDKIILLEKGLIAN